jgi:hypothetical protein
LALAALAALVAGGCIEEPPPLHELHGLRVLGIAADAPALLPGTETTVRALVYSEGDLEISYAWDWCPFPSGPVNEYACGISQAELDELASSIPGVDAPSLALGDSPEVVFSYPFTPEFLSGICDIVSREDIPAFVVLPDCKERFPVTLRLVVSSPQGQRVVAVKTLQLLYGEPSADDSLNTNPVIAGVRVARAGKAKEDAEPLDDGFVMERGAKYTLFVDVQESQAQMYLSKDGPLRENLSLQWLYEGGEMTEFTTGFIDGILGFEDLEENRFSSPDGVYGSDELQLHFVIRDERGGLGWASRVVVLK